MPQRTALTLRPTGTRRSALPLRPGLTQRPALTLRPALILAAALAAALLLPPPAGAEPATPVTYPSGATATRQAGRAFDTCTAPSLATMTAWSASPYRIVGIYFGGVNRTCAQPQLTAGWVAGVTGQGWRLLPIYKGLQPPCGGKPTDAKIDPARATAQGTTAANNALENATALGLRRGSAFYNDIEHYSTTDTTCRTAVLRYLSAWTKRLHRLGYVSGVYANLNSGAQHLARSYNSTAYARPDALWIARYDGSPSLRDWAGIPNTAWAVHQRAKQYAANVSETYGGVTVNIDRDQLDAPLATIAYRYATTAQTTARTGPKSSAAAVRTYSSGAAVQVVCQTTGSTVGTTKVWDKLTDGTYVTDYHVSTPSKRSYSEPLPRCSYPYQVATTGYVNERTGPGLTYPVAGRLPNGALAWVVCQRAGSKVGTTSVWNRLDDGRWVSDHYIATPSAVTYSAPIPRC